MTIGRLSLTAAALALASSIVVPAQGSRHLDRGAEKWVRDTLKKMTVEEKVGQMIVSSFFSTFMSTDSAEFDALVKAVHEQKVGGFHVFGGRERSPSVRLNPTAGCVPLAQPREAAARLVRRQEARA